MARKRIVSRTIRTTEVMVKGYDPTADSISDVKLMLTGVTKECSDVSLVKMCDEALKKLYPGTHLVVLKVSVVDEKTSKYVMDEDQFVMLAEEKEAAEDSEESEE